MTPDVFEAATTAIALLTLLHEGDDQDTAEHLVNGLTEQEAKAVVRCSLGALHSLMTQVDADVPVTLRQWGVEIAKQREAL